jgi:predicted transcriptional regulator of viral defense system
MLDALPSAFTMADARHVGLRKDQIYKCLEAGEVERLGRGTFIKTDSIDPSLAGLAAATALQPRATLCLTSALARYGLSDAIPSMTDIALPRGIRRPAGFHHVSWHSFDRAVFDIGRTRLEGDEDLFAYSPERSIIDSFRLAHLEGSDVAVEALKRRLRQRGNYPARILDMAKAFPKAYPAIRSTLEVLV